MKIGIVGSSLTSRHLAPFDDPSWLWWGMNDLFTVFPDTKWHRWFELHEIKKVGDRWFRKDSKTFRDETVNNYLHALSRLPCPIYMQRKWSEIPNSVEYPISAIKANFRSTFSGSVALMTALALYEEANTLGFWGVDLSMGDEYIEQKPALWYLLGLAEGRDVELVIPPESDLLKCRRIYGFEDSKEEEFTTKLKACISSLETEKERITSDLAKVTNAKAEITGSINSLKDILDMWK